MKRAFVNGSFDVLHPGHVALLEYARSQADHLTVATDSDRRIRERKGPDRPLNSARDRVTMLRALRCVDDVLLFDTDSELRRIVRTLAPDIMVVGDDYRDQVVIGSEYATELEFFTRIPRYSSTQTIQRARGGGLVS